MAVEIEAKIRVAGLQGYAAQLRELGASLRGQVMQRDLFFDRAAGSLRAGDMGLRLREERRSQGVTVQMCYKGPRRNGRYKEREEIQFTVSDAEQGRAFLAALGFQATLTVQKRRELWLLQGCEVCLDQVQQLGTFVEVEGPDPDNVTKVLQALGLNDAEHIAKSYVTMLAEKIEKEG